MESRVVYDSGGFASGQLVGTEMNQRSANDGRRTCDGWVFRKRVSEVATREAKSKAM